MRTAPTAARPAENIIVADRADRSTEEPKRGLPCFHSEWRFSRHGRFCPCGHEMVPDFDTY